MGKTLRAILAGMGLIAATVAGGAAAAATPAPFPDVPPWHWAVDAVAADQAAGLLVGYPTAPAEAVENAVTQVYDGFTHARATGAQAWVERFTYNRPANWPAPLAQARIGAFSFTGTHVAFHGDTATAVFTATVRTLDGRTRSTPVRLELRANGPDWQVNYAELAAANPVFP